MDDDTKVAFEAVGLRIGDLKESQQIQFAGLRELFDERSRQQQEVISAVTEGIAVNRTEIKMVRKDTDAAHRGLRELVTRLDTGEATKTAVWKAREKVRSHWKFWLGTIGTLLALPVTAWTTVQLFALLFR